MKIAYFLDIPKGLGGAGNLLIQQARLMSEMYDVIVVIPEDEDGRGNQEYIRRCEKQGLPYQCLKYRAVYNFLDIDYTAAMKSAFAIEEFVSDERITFFHSVQLNIAVEYVSRKLKIPHLMNIYQLREEEFEICPGNIYAKYHLCDSLLYSELWKRQLGLISRYIRPVALLDDVKKKALLPRYSIKMLMLGMICERKNQLEAIKAVEQCLGSCHLELCIAGELCGDYAKECVKYVKEHQLDGTITFSGFVNDVEPLLEECDCLLCTSTNESFPSSMVEALSYDMTIISTPVAGVPEVFSDQYNAFVCKGFSAREIKVSILECVSCYADGKIIGIHKNAADTWKKNFDRKVVRQQIDEYYKSILGDKSFENADIFEKLREEILCIEADLKEIDVEDEKWIFTRGLYYTFIKKRLGSGKVYIWGAGKRGRIALRLLKKICPNLTVSAFVDRNKEGEYMGLPVIRPDDILFDKESLYCISFAQCRDEAIRYLVKGGLALNQQIWCIP